jgi:hypothetical protein
MGARGGKKSAYIFDLDVHLSLQKEPQNLQTARRCFFIY